jgi:alkyldihydroxyacetonephosphate synthase
VPDALSDIVRTDHLTRLEHSYGKAGFDTTRMFMRQVPNPPDAVAFPENEQDVVRPARLVRPDRRQGDPLWRRLVGGEGHRAQCRRFDKVVTISTRHMDKVLEVDAVSHAARIQGGIYGPCHRGPAARHALHHAPYMQAYRCSTLGGWIATRSGGHYATLYTHIDDFVESTRVVTPAGTLETRRLPGSGGRPQPRPACSSAPEGILGIITEAWVRLRKKPDVPSLGLGALQELLRRRRRGARDHPGGALSRQLPSARGARGTAQHPVEQRGGRARAAFESADHPLDAWMKRTLEILRRPWRRARARRRRRERPSFGRRRRLAQQVHPAPHYGEHAVARGILSSTFETSMTWERIPRLPQQDHEDRQDTIKRVTGATAPSPAASPTSIPTARASISPSAASRQARQLEQFMEVLSTCTGGHRRARRDDHASIMLSVASTGPSMISSGRSCSPRPCAAPSASSIPRA